MSERDDLVALLRAHEGREWRPRQAASEAEVSAVEKQLKREFTPDYRRLLIDSGGGSLYGPDARVIFYTPRDLLEFNPDMELSPELADMLIFGDDEGDFIYYFDPPNKLGRGAWAIFIVEKSVSDFESSRFVAADLRGLCERVLGGENVYDAPYVGPASKG